VAVLLANFFGGTLVAVGVVILVIGLAHFTLAIGAVLFAVWRLKASVFTETMAELKKDQEWLNQTTK
jgi:hypothetical protein